MAFEDNLTKFVNYCRPIVEGTIGDDVMQKEFIKLKQVTGKLRHEKGYSTDAGEKEINIKKNRYKDIVPFDNCRVILKTNNNSGPDGADYINASYIQGTREKHAYIAAQGPLPSTVNDFWKLLWQSGSNVIIMACNEYELSKSGIRQHKCERYWADEAEEKAFNDIVVTLQNSEIKKKDFKHRTLKAKKGSEERTFHQFHYTAWPDHGVPETVNSIIDLVQEARNIQSHQDRPLIVHCSAGCGRTGTILVLDIISELIKDKNIADNFSLYDTIYGLRTQRIALVQSKEQYEFVHKAIFELFNRELGVDYGHNYENVQIGVVSPGAPDKPKMPPGLPVAGKVNESRPNSQSDLKPSSSRILPKPISPGPTTAAHVDQSDNKLKPQKPSHVTNAPPATGLGTMFTPDKERKHKPRQLSDGGISVPQIKQRHSSQQDINNVVDSERVIFNPLIPKKPPVKPMPKTNQRREKPNSVFPLPPPSNNRSKAPVNKRPNHQGTAQLRVLPFPTGDTKPILSVGNSNRSVERKPPPNNVNNIHTSPNIANIRENLNISQIGANLTGGKKGLPHNGRGGAANRPTVPPPKPPGHHHNDGSSKHTAVPSESHYEAVSNKNIDRSPSRSLVAQKDASSVNPLLGMNPSNSINPLQGMNPSNSESGWQTNDMYATSTKSPMHPSLKSKGPHGISSQGDMQVNSAYEISASGNSGLYPQPADEDNPYDTVASPRLSSEIQTEAGAVTRRSSSNNRTRSDESSQQYDFVSTKPSPLTTKPSPLTAKPTSQSHPYMQVDNGGSKVNSNRASTGSSNPNRASTSSSNPDDFEVPIVPERTQESFVLIDDGL